ncbi:hypothetical protein DOY81_008062 [Sarcophaga bullata]|nr:hypothetical protein DOY81_008062 [Sarcophaga bullata]
MSAEQKINQVWVQLKRLNVNLIMVLNLWAEMKRSKHNRRCQIWILLLRRKIIARTQQHNKQKKKQAPCSQSAATQIVETMRKAVSAINRGVKNR